MLTQLLSLTLKEKRTTMYGFAKRCFSNALNSKLMYERELRATLHKLERIATHIPEEHTQKKTLDDLSHLSTQFRDLIFLDDKFDPAQTEDQLLAQDLKIEQQMKKLLTVAKSKYYLLRVNHPGAFEGSRVDKEVTTEQMTDADELLKEKKRETIGTQGVQGAPVAVDEDESAENKQKREEIIRKDKKRLEAMDEQTKEIVKSLEGLKKIDEYNSENMKFQEERRKTQKYISREEDQELKSLYEEEQKRFEKLQESLARKIDGQIDMDMHGNVRFRPADAPWKPVLEEDKNQEGGIQGPGTYVLRDGKLVPGTGETREQAQYSNWYCSNADPEDIRRHRELMDRMHYRGPKWEGQGVPKSILEEYDPTYRKVDPDPHPMDAHPDKEGKKEFEYVVR
ncbi:hypothetical protein FGO68_gene9940 [Halteria grandinella]|uniref:Uncharacterized protein n=1 Tax=Halteria grandinella TaxID=5974 RepID=A0A8J8NET6_HALGN|nr:hypothetical protein FGO68_gene9940 [Halteria grandinella]